jgi:hypothetical protein
MTMTTWEDDGLTGWDVGACPVYWGSGREILGRPFRFFWTKGSTQFHYLGSIQIGFWRVQISVQYLNRGDQNNDISNGVS